MSVIQHGTINEFVAERAVAMVSVVKPEQDPEAVANGARVTSEIMLRTLGNLGIDLPKGFPEMLAAEFIEAQDHERAAMGAHLEDARAFAASA